MTSLEQDAAWGVTGPTDGLSTRQQELVSAAAALFAQRGYHAVSLSDISASLGMTGPAVYRHFKSKQALLVAVLDTCIDALLDEIRLVVDCHREPAATLVDIVDRHLHFVFTQSGNITTWRTDFASLPPLDRSRLRRQQRRYTEEWVEALRRLRPDLTVAHARALVSGVIGLLQSPTESTSELGPHEHRAVLRQAALDVLLQPLQAALPDQVSPVP